jgi:hypothetical protein
MSCVGTWIPMTDEEKAARMAGAILNSLDTWCSAIEEIADAALPVTGNKRRALHLLKAMEQARGALREIAGLDP